MSEKHRKQFAHQMCLAVFQHLVLVVQTIGGYMYSLGRGTMMKINYAPFGE